MSGLVSLSTWFRRDESPVPYSRLLAAVGVGLVIFASAAPIIAASFADQSEEAVTHSFEVQEATRNAFSLIQDAESGQRGYLLTGNNSYLAPYKAALLSLERQLPALRQMTSNDPAQLVEFARIQSLAAAKLAELARSIAYAGAGDRASALQLVRSNRGQELMDALRAEFAAFSKAELRRLKAQEERADQLRDELLALMIAGLLIALSITGYLLLSLMRAIGKLEERTMELQVETLRRSQIEETLRQAQKIEAVGQLTGGIAHDFNNLLTVIIGNLDTIKRRLQSASHTQPASEIVATTTPPLEMALQGARNAAQLTNRLLTFARRQTLKPERLDLNALVTGMTDLLRRTMGETINIETTLAGGLWPTFADPNQVESAVLNLCINARDAMPNGGKLTLETATTYLDNNYTDQFADVKPGQYVLLSVTDTGSGIPPDVIDKVFEPFFSTKLPGAGSGLGLAVVHGFVKQSGGHIRIYSELGHGTTVKVYLPRLMEAETRSSAPAPVPVAQSSSPRPGQQETILVVEDDDGVRGYAKSTLEELNYRVLAAANAAEAMQIAENSGAFDLLFTDVVLPDWNGRKLADEIRKHRPNLPVLFTTGYTRNAIIHQGRLDPDVQLLGKPYTQLDLARRIRELLDGGAEAHG